MKSLIPVVMVVGLQGSRSMFAAAEHSLLREEIGRNILYPEFARAFHLEGVVNVDISTDTTGKVSVNDSTGTHPGLLEYVTDKLIMMIVRDDESREKRFRLILKFIMY